jgi:hypothetical protein
MVTVRADAQRPEIRRMDAAAGFPARLDAARAAEDEIAGAE